MHVFVVSSLILMTATLKLTHVNITLVMTVLTVRFSTTSIDIVQYLVYSYHCEAEWVCKTVLINSLINYLKDT